MGPFLCLYASLIGFFAFAALYHLILWSWSRRENLLLVFSADCAVRAALSGALVAISVATTPADAFRALWARIALGMLMMVTWLWSLSLVTGVRARWFVWPMTGAFLVLLPIHVLVTPFNATVDSVEKMAMPWGETISVPHLGTPGWWVGPIYALAIIMGSFGLVCGIHLLRRDRLAGALIVTAACGTLVVLTLEVLRSYINLPLPFIGAIPQVIWVGVIALLIARGHRRTREQLIASEQRFRGIFDQTFQFIGLIETDGTLIEANRTALEFARIREEDVIGKPLWETPWWTHSPELQNRLQDAVVAASAGNTVRFEVTHAHPVAGLVHVDFSLKPIRNAEGQVILLIPEGRDISERKQAEETRRTLESQLAQAQKMKAIGQLASGVAHDFNNLLTVINGYTELLLTMSPRHDADLVMLEGIRDAGVRAASLTRQLLTFSRQQVVAPRVLNLNEVVAQTEEMLRRMIGESIRLLTVLQPDLACVRADSGQIGQVIMNLAVNARDAMPSGGRLTIETSNVEITKADAASHPAVEPGHYVVLSVTDTGSGMTPDVQARVFEPYFTTKGPEKGTGLGLATVRIVADASSGFLKVKSEPGRGSTFQLLLPALAATETVEGLVSGGKAAPRGSETILLVEDQDAVRLLTRQLLEQFGYSVVEASGGRDAISLVQQSSKPIDLLVTDVVMPEMGGRQLAKSLSLARPGLKVLYLSGYADDVVVRHGVSQADAAFLQKPFTIEALANKVRQTLDAATSPSCA